MPSERQQKRRRSHNNVPTPEPEPARRTGNGKRSLVTTMTPDPMAWAVARELADGDTRRLSVTPDGSVILHNGRVR